MKSNFLKKVKNVCGTGAWTDCDFLEFFDSIGHGHDTGKDGSYAVSTTHLFNSLSPSCHSLFQNFGSFDRLTDFAWVEYLFHFGVIQMSEPVFDEIDISVYGNTKSLCIKFFMIS